MGRHAIGYNADYRINSGPRRDPKVRMEKDISSLQEAIDTLANPQDPNWGQAFAFLSRHPDTAAMMIETFRDTLAQMGLEASGVDSTTGQPAFSLADMARAMGVPAEQLERAVDQAQDAIGD